MPISSDQLRVLEALDKSGSITGASAVLHKAHTAVIYAMKNIESEVGSPVFDRSGYRTKLTPFGKRILEEGHKVLQAESELQRAVSEIKSGYEPFMKVVIDGAFPIKPVLLSIRQLLDRKIPTKIKILSEYLGGVEELFVRKSATFFISVFPPSQPGIISKKFLSFKTYLVTHKNHPVKVLKDHTLLTVRGSAKELHLETSEFDRASQFQLSDFPAKKEALMMGLGYGWMPEHFIEKELKSGTLKKVMWEGPSVRVLQTYLCYDANRTLGPASQLFIKLLKQNAS